MALLSSESLPSLLTVFDCSGVPEKRTGPAQKKAFQRALRLRSDVVYLEVVPREYALRLKERPGASVWVHANAMGTCILRMRRFR